MEAGFRVLSDEERGRCTALLSEAALIIDTYNAEKESITTQIRQELMQSMKQPSGGGSGDGQKEFSKMTMQERMELKQRNPELYKAESAKLAKHF